LKLPLDEVAVVSAHFQPPFFCFWMTTRTIERQAVSPLDTFTCPETRLCGWNPNPEIVRPTGAVVTVKSAVLVTVPPGVVSEILPVVAVAGTTAVTDVAVFAENVAVTPLNLTEETPVRFVPVITTLVPALPLVGVNDVMVGAAATVKTVALFAGPPPVVVTWSRLVVAPAGTVAVICVAEFTTNVAPTAPNCTDVVQPKFVPVMTTLDPTAPLVGRNDEIVGTPAAATMKFVVLIVLPVGASTEIGPLAAPAGTVGVIDVFEATVNTGWFVAPNRTAVASPLLLKPKPVMVTGVVATPHVGENDVIDAAEAGSAVTSIPTPPSASASADATTRVDTFMFWNLTERSSLQGSHRDVMAPPIRSRDPLPDRHACGGVSATH